MPVRRPELSLVLFLLFAIKVKCGTYVDLDPFVKGNLEFFQAVFPPNVKLDGTLLFGQIDAPNASFHNVVLSEIADFGSENFVQFIDLVTMVNNVSGTFYSECITVDIQQIVAPSYFGPLSPLRNTSIDLKSPAFNVYVIMSPTPDSQSCTLTVTIDLSIEQAVLHSDIPFADGRNITQFFDDTIVNYFNENLSTMTRLVSDADCSANSFYLTLAESLENLSRNNFGGFIKL